MSLIHRAVTALVSSALALSVVAADDPAQAAAPGSPAGHGAGWLASQLNSRHLIHNPNFGGFDDYGLTLDTAFGLRAVGGHKLDVARVAKAMSKHVDDYVTFNSPAVFAGSLAKLLVFAQDTRSGPRSYGGTNLVGELAQRVITTGPSTGRIQDLEDPTFPGDSANTIGQIFAVRGLLRAGRADGRAALDFLLAQQCGRGYFRLSLTEDKTATDQACGKGDPADTDVTALAVVELTAVAKGHGRLKGALGAATRWLARHQHANGSLGGAGPTSAANANSTGLAGWAFLTRGRCGPARDAARWLVHRQVAGALSGTPLAGERGAVGYDNPTLRAARSDGIVKATRDRWRRATSQAAPALLALSRCPA